MCVCVRVCTKGNAAAAPGTRMMMMSDGQTDTGTLVLQWWWWWLSWQSVRADGHGNLPSAAATAAVGTSWLFQGYYRDWERLHWGDCCCCRWLKTVALYFYFHVYSLCLYHAHYRPPFLFPSPFCGWQWTEVHVSEWCRWSKYNVTITGILMKMGNTGSTGGAGEKTTSGKCQRWPASLFVCVCVCACVCWEVFLSVDTDNDSNAHTHRYSHQQIAFAWAESAGKGRRKKEREKTKEKERKRVPMRTSARMQEKTLGNELK